MLNPKPYVFLTFVWAIVCQAWSIHTWTLYEHQGGTRPVFFSLKVNQQQALSVLNDVGQWSEGKLRAGRRPNRQAIYVSRKTEEIAKDVIVARKECKEMLDLIQKHI